MIDRAKLARILSLFSSEHDGEVVSAARAAHKIVAAAGSNWAELLDTRIPPEPTLNGPWLDLQTRDAALYAWIMSNFELNSVAHRLWSGMGTGQYLSDGAIRIGRAAMFLNRSR